MYIDRVSYAYDNCHWARLHIWASSYHNDVHSRVHVKQKEAFVNEKLPPHHTLHQMQRNSNKIPAPHAYYHTAFNFERRNIWLGFSQFFPIRFHDTVHKQYRAHCHHSRARARITANKKLGCINCLSDFHHRYTRLFTISQVLNGFQIVRRTICDIAKWLAAAFSALLFSLPFSLA